MMEALSTFETPVNFYQTIWRNIPEDVAAGMLGYYWYTRPLTTCKYE
jgi:hypothetical protein